MRKITVRIFSSSASFRLSGLDAPRCQAPFLPGVPGLSGDAICSGKTDGAKESGELDDKEDIVTVEEDDKV